MKRLRGSSWRGLLGAYQSIGQRLWALRARQGISSAQVAKELGVSQRHYMALERGDHGMSLEQFCKVCEVVGVSPAVVFLDEVWK